MPAAVFTVNIHPWLPRSRIIIDIDATGVSSLPELARLARVRRFSYISSGSVYRMPRQPD